MVKGHLDLKAINVSKTVWESVSHPRSEMCQGPLSKFNSTIKLLSGMLPVLSQVTRAGVPTLTLTLGLLSRDRPGCSFRLNLGEAEGEEAVSFLIFCSVGMVLISSHQLHTNTGCFPEKGRAKWRGLWNVLDAECLLHYRMLEQYSRRHSAEQRCIKISTFISFPRPTTGLYSMENQWSPSSFGWTSTTAPLFSRLGPYKGKEIIFLLICPLYVPSASSLLFSLFYESADHFCFSSIWFVPY